MLDLAQDLCHQAGSKWCLTKVAVAHKTGLCPVGETSVVIAASSTHRQDALQVLTSNYVLSATSALVAVCFLVVHCGDLLAPPTVTLGADHKTFVHEGCCMADR